MNNLVVHEIKNLTIIDINRLIEVSITQAKNFCKINDINYDNYITDIYSLTLHYFFLNFFTIYKNKTTKNILCYANDINLSNNSNHNICTINLKIIKLIKNKPFNFPILLSNIKIEDYINLVSDDSPEYDEAINNNFSLIDNFAKIKQYIKKSKLLALDKKYSNLNEELGLLLNI